MADNPIGITPATGTPELARFSREVIQALRKLDVRFLGALIAKVIAWVPFGGRGPQVVNGMFYTRTLDNVQKRLAELPLRDAATSKVVCTVTAKSITGAAYSVDMTVQYTRLGTSVTTTLALASANEVTSTWDATISTVTVGSDVSLVVLVTGASSTTIDWMCELRVYELPTVVAA